MTYTRFTCQLTGVQEGWTWKRSVWGELFVRELISEIPNSSCYKWGIYLYQNE